jgi:hypothetical protein
LTTICCFGGSSGLGIDDPVWDHSTFSKSRDRLLDADVAAKFLEAVLRHPKVKRFLVSAAGGLHLRERRNLIVSGSGGGRSI